MLDIGRTVSFTPNMLFLLIKEPIKINILFNNLFLSVVGFEVPDKFVVGYALDYNEYFRDLNVSIFERMKSFLRKLAPVSCLKRS